MTDNSVPIEVTEAAAHWLDRLRSAQGSDGAPLARLRNEFADWLLRSPVHVAEFLRLSALETDLIQALQTRPDWDAALPVPDTAKVLRLSELAPERPRPFAPRTVKTRRRWAMAAAAAGFAATAWLLQSTFRADPPTVATALGEQRSILLADGSTMMLNTSSAARIRITSETRQLDLLRGEMLVDVAKDAARPFRVLSGDLVVEAAGTRFNIHRRADTTVVTVIEGRVLLDRRLSERTPTPGMVADGTGLSVATAAMRLELSGGQQAAVPAGAAPVEPAPANLERATAWTERRLVFEHETVGDIAAQFNRYNRSRLLIGDLGLASRQITGVLDVNDPDAFVALLEELDSIEVRLTPEGHREILLGSRRRE